MANYPQELAQDAVCQSHTGHMTGLWFLPALPLRLNINEWMNHAQWCAPSIQTAPLYAMISYTMSGYKTVLDLTPYCTALQMIFLLCPGRQTTRNEKTDFMFQNVRRQHWGILYEGRKSSFNACLCYCWKDGGTNKRRLQFDVKYKLCADTNQVRIYSWRMKDQLDVTCYFISLLTCSTCFGY